jgi:hypothetical protein
MVSAGKGPLASMPSARSASMAGATMSMSSRPSEPSSPACGLRPDIASRGRARPKCAFRSATAIRAVVTISSLESWASASRSERWMVTGTTASAGDHSIITGCGARPPSAASSARNSVWPGWRKPARYSTLLAIGLVTTAPALPRLTWSTAWRMEASAAVALVSSGCPGRAVAISPVATTGKAFANAAPASSGTASASSTCNPRIFARSAKNARSPSR